jgi:hypothetical protein
MTRLRKSVRRSRKPKMVLSCKKSMGRRRSVKSKSRSKKCKSMRVRRSKKRKSRSRKRKSKRDGCDGGGGKVATSMYRARKRDGCGDGGEDEMDGGGMYAQKYLKYKARKDGSAGKRRKSNSPTPSATSSDVPRRP